MRGIASVLFLAFIGQAAHAACDIEIGSTDQMSFDKTEIVVERTCENVTLTLTHTGKLPVNVMGHNWVLSRSEDFNPIATDGMAAGVEKGYLKENDSRVLAATKLIGGGEQTTITFSLSELTEDEYVFFCSFPGHWAVMKGTFKIV
ncbi:MAG: azurin [Pseudomonadota bacterium]